MYYTLTAQPIHEDGTVGFESRNPLTEHGTGLIDVFSKMGNTLLDHVGDRTVWDLTLEVSV